MEGTRQGKLFVKTVWLISHLKKDKNFVLRLYKNVLSLRHSKSTSRLIWIIATQIWHQNPLWHLVLTHTPM